MICYGNKLIGGVGVIEETVTPPPGLEYNYFCPQTLAYAYLLGYESPSYSTRQATVACTIANPPELYTSEGQQRPFLLGRAPVTGYGGSASETIDDNYIEEIRALLGNMPEDRRMTPETEKWLKDRIGWKIFTFTFSASLSVNSEDYQKCLIAGTSALHCEMKEVLIVQQ